MAVKYGSDEALEKIFKKSKEIRDTRERRRITVLATITSVLACLLIATVVLLKGQTLSEATSSHLGAFLLPSEAGGYVLVGVAAFILGIVITVCTLAYRKRNKEKKERKERGTEQ